MLPSILQPTTALECKFSTTSKYTIHTSIVRDIGHLNLISLDLLELALQMVWRDL